VHHTIFRKKLPRDNVQVDTDRDGTVNFQEFVKLMTDKKHAASMEQELRDAFNIFDKDKSGFIDVSELRSAMIALGSLPLLFRIECH
jgi:Ca2+-binding EF-hand superfamily protein